MKAFKKLTAKHKLAIIIEIKLMIAAHRAFLWDCWTECSHARAVDPTKWQVVTNEGSYGEAFGIMRGLAAAGYGYFGSDTESAVDEDRSNIPEHNLKWWFRQIVNDYLDEEGFFNETCTAEKCKELRSKFRLLVRK